MGCPILRFLPEIAGIALRMKSQRVGTSSLVGVAEEMCRQCRAKTPGGHCPVGKKFGEAMHQSLSTLTQIIVEERGGESRGREPSVSEKPGPL